MGFATLVLEKTEGKATHFAEKDETTGAGGCGVFFEGGDLGEGVGAGKFFGVGDDAFFFKFGDFVEAGLAEFLFRGHREKVKGLMLF